MKVLFLVLRAFSENKRERYIKDDEFEAILRHLQEDHKEMFLALYHTAQRPGESMIYSGHK